MQPSACRLRFVLAECIRVLRNALVALFLASGNAAGASLQSGDVIGNLDAHVALFDDTLLDLAIEHDLGYIEILAANPGIDPWLPGDGTFVVLPTMHVLPTAERRGIVINLAEMRLYWFQQGGQVVTMPIGIGSEGWTSPLGQTSIVRKRANPTWVPPPSVRAEDPELPSSVPPGPDNPLGAHALDLGWPAVVLHGTNRPYGIGRRVSHGCFRLSSAHAERLYRDVPVGTPVNVVDQPIKLGWRAGALYLEIHPTQSQADELERTGRITDTPISGLREKISRTAAGQHSEIDWAIVERAARERSGVPVRITH
jgi:L,D-transpeptidase ErfK/SrfK